MSEIDDGGNAFPRPEISGYVRAGDKEAELWERQKSGMSMREWYAGMALQGLCANPNIIGWTENKGSGYKLDNGLEREQLVFRSFMVADAVIRAGKGEK